ncbi:hypothetical protein BKA67DRAFT_516331 [Truncatella angustata]|uniref:DNA polymerase n=1 Tax=Truncatella angustata TaxID=152316 RepID=A0A9P8UMQ2_9PEZI|nr:uncharacterized protein BKA67DRAFT_516331 [Truncatella angustata]KAH6654942.1 hypothetical protein BKA67DRAFT_516331 [Truncatella angustata]
MATLDMPAIYLLPTHIDSDELPKLEGQIPSLTSDIREADVVLAKISKKERARFELRRRGIVTTEVSSDVDHGSPPPAKRRRGSVFQLHSAVEGSSTASGSEEDMATVKLTNHQARASNFAHNEKGPADLVKVVHLSWFIDSVAKGHVLPVRGYLIYQGCRDTEEPHKKQAQKPADILKRARDEGESDNRSHRSSHGYVGSDLHPRTAVPLNRPALLKETTSEHDRDIYLPPIPEYLHTTYSCQRPTPLNPPNNAFIEELKKIRTIRALTGDKVGVRAYSTCIASLAAYPYLLGSAQEVSRLPGCGPKIAVLFQEWKETGKIQGNEAATADPQILVLQLFYEIWGVGETTARSFYNKGWRDLDDIVEFGWSSLLRVQQIGVKYHDEFLLKIPRAEVKDIGNTILAHARRIRKGYQMVIVGGYRRGKRGSGDVDVVLSHPDLEATRNFIEELVVVLEKDQFITHTLTLSTKNSERGQIPVAWKGEDRSAGSGFDTLDKALVVWQNPKWDETKARKNPNPHRRVDIIIAPWKTAGCAVLGWSGGTTFQRDIRRYCNAVRHLKFDSSGIRSRVDGHWVDLESTNGIPAPDMLTAEKRVFEGLGLEYRPPEERCTG